jgi:hypothetical protein
MLQIVRKPFMRAPCGRARRRVKARNSILRHSGARRFGAKPESRNDPLPLDSGFALRAPRNDGLLQRRLADHG